jgi:methionyl-tRNA formyltransferase
MRVVFLGNAEWSVPALDALARTPELEVVLVVTDPPHPVRRGSANAPSPVATAARDLRLHLTEVEGLREGEGLGSLHRARPDVLVVVAYGEILTDEVLDVPPLGAINLHFSLLPRWRGAAPVQHALLAGDPATGVTTMRMDQGLDTGPILAQRSEPIAPEDDAGTLGERLALLGADLLVSTIRNLRELIPRAQDATAATRAPKISPTDRVLDWREPAGSIERRIRALAPQPGARTTFRGLSLGVLSAETAEASGDPATILGVDQRGVLIAAGEGAVRLRSVVPSGRRHMPAVEWAKGARFAPGERVG